MEIPFAADPQRSQQTERALLPNWLTSAWVAYVFHLFNETMMRFLIQKISKGNPSTYHTLQSIKLWTETWAECTTSNGISTTKFRYLSERSFKEIHIWCILSALQLNGFYAHVHVPRNGLIFPSFFFGSFILSSLACSYVDRLDGPVAGSSSKAHRDDER